MKCIKVVKEAKSYTLGEIRRVADIEADERVKTGIWKFVPKSEWKEATRKPKNEVVSDEIEKVKVPSKKQLKKQKSDK